MTQTTAAPFGVNTMTLMPRLCPWCGITHGPRCPSIQAIEYHPDGSIKRVEFVKPEPIAGFDPEILRKGPAAATASPSATWVHPSEATWVHPSDPRSMAAFWRRFADREDVRNDTERRINALQMALEWDAAAPPQNPDHKP